MKIAKAVPHPIPYQGSKRTLAPIILDYFPADAQRLIEPFAGSAAVSLAALHQQSVKQVVINDINAPLIQLWRSIAHQPDALARLYRELWQAQLGRERRFYDLVRARFNQTYQPYYLLYLLARCVKAAIRYNANGDFNQSPDNRRKGRNPNTMERDIRNTAALLKNRADLLTMDYTKALRLATPTDIVYLDPPYQGVCATRDPRYMMGVDFEGFVTALQGLNARDVSYILSYDGRTGTKKFGQPLPESLQLERIEVNAGRSSQATLLGRSETTYESLYLSPALVDRLGMQSKPTLPKQIALFEDIV